MATNKGDLRTERRIAQARRGTLTFAEISVPCVIQDFSTTGFLIMCSKPFPAGTVLDLKSELYPNEVLTCKLEVRHVTDMCLGTKIVEISNPAARLCQRFIEEFYSERLKFGR